MHSLYMPVVFLVNGKQNGQMSKSFLRYAKHNAKKIMFKGMLSSFLIQNVYFAM